MRKHLRIPSQLACSFLLCGVLSTAALAADLSKYRNFEFGMSPQAIAKQVGASPAQVKVVNSRPALIQSLEWDPRPMGPTVESESAKELEFSFYNGGLYRIVVNYDRYEMEGMTADDVVEAVSAMYGPASKPAPPAKAETASYGDQEEEVLAQWQDALHSFDLVRVSYGPTFKLVGVLKSVDASAQAATLEAAKLDLQEAPQKDAERVAAAQEADKVRLDKARSENMPKFRP